MYIPLLTVAHGHSPPHCEKTQVLREAITEDDDDDDKSLYSSKHSRIMLKKWGFGTCLWWWGMKAHAEPELPRPELPS